MSVSKDQEKEEPSKASDAVKIKWDQDHNDPSAGIILVASDGTHFRVHEWFLRRNSQFIADLLTLPSTTTVSQTPIHLDSPASTLEIYITLVYGGSIFVNIDVPDLIGLIALCDRMQSSDLLSWLDSMVFRDVVRIHPLHAFVYASRRGDLVGGVAAIRRFPQKLDVINLAPWIRRAMDPEWMSCLYRETLVAIAAAGRIQSYTTKTWDKVAEGFKPEIIS